MLIFREPRSLTRELKTGEIKAPTAITFRSNYISSNYLFLYIVIRDRPAFSLVASCVLLKYTRTDDVN